MWIDQIPVISTGHVKLEELDELYNDSVNLLFRYPEGVIVWFGCDEPDESLGLPPTILAVLKWAHEKEFSWVRLDADGDIVEGLPEYEHEGAQRSCSAKEASERRLRIKRYLQSREKWHCC